MIKEFSVSCSKTVNLGSYNSIRVEASLVIAVPEGGDYPLLKAQAQEELKNLLDETYKAQKRGE